MLAPILALIARARIWWLRRDLAAIEREIAEAHEERFDALLMDRHDAAEALSLYIDQLRREARMLRPAIARAQEWLPTTR